MCAGTHFKTDTLIHQCIKSVVVATLNTCSTNKRIKPMNEHNDSLSSLMLKYKKLDTLITIYSLVASLKYNF